MEKYRLVRMNVVKYTDDEFILEQLLDEGYTLEPAFEPDKEPTDGTGGVGDKEPDKEPTDGGKKSTKSSKK